jgi:translation initiation factor 3 subunit I
LLLKGHERPITDVKYNRDGDMIFLSSKDSSVSVWWTDNGERIGTYDGHNGAIFSIDINRAPFIAFVTLSGLFVLFAIAALF